MQSIKVKEVFKVTKPTRVSVNALGEPIEGSCSYPLVGYKEENKGIHGYYKRGNQKLTDGKCILLTSSIAVYVEKDFFCAVEGVRLESKQEMTLREYMYYSLCLKRYASRLKSISREVNVEIVEELEILSLESLPDWVKEKSKEIELDNPKVEELVELKVSEKYEIEGVMIGVEIPVTDVLQEGKEQDETEENKVLEERKIELDKLEEELFNREIQLEGKLEKLELLALKYKEKEEYLSDREYNVLQREKSVAERETEIARRDVYVAKREEAVVKREELVNTSIKGKQK